MPVVFPRASPSLQSGALACRSRRETQASLRLTQAGVTATTVGTWGSPSDPDTPSGPFVDTTPGGRQPPPPALSLEDRVWGVSRSGLSRSCALSGVESPETTGT